jgi:hypothetical protein
MTLAQLLRHDPRTPWEVVLDATNTADALMRDVKSRVLDGGDVTVEQVDRLLELTTYAHKLATVAIQTGAAAHVAQARVELLQSQTQIMIGATRVAVEGLLDHLVALGAVDPAYAARLRTWAWEAAARRAENPEAESVELPPLPAVPVDAVRIVEHDGDDDHDHDDPDGDEDAGHDRAAAVPRHGRPAWMRVVDEPASDPPSS